MAASAPVDPHWSGDGQYACSVVGESYARDALAEIAQNPPGKSALVFCSASLIPEPNNPYDSNAIGVEICGRVVGHLSRDDARAYSERLHDLKMSSLRATAQAVVSGGLVTSAKHYDYIVQLDIAPTSTLQFGAESQNDEIVRLNDEPMLIAETPFVWSAEVWLPVPRTELCTELSVETWTTDRWDLVNFYVLNRQRIGLGFKLLGVPKPQYLEQFGGRELDMSLEPTSGRWAKLKVRVLGPGPSSDA